MASQSIKLILNHVAFTVERDLLVPAGRERLLAFYEGCLDFEMAAVPPPRDGEFIMLVRRESWQNPPDAGATYFVFFGHDTPALMNAGNSGDHVGLTCGSLDLFKAYLQRVKGYAGRYGLGEIDYQVKEIRAADGGGVYKLHTCYIQPFDAPITVELQYPEAAGDQPVPR